MSTRTVLILTDRPPSMPSWMEAFEQRGLEAVTTASPARALHQWQTDIPLLTVVDLSLPLADSLAICRQLRDLAPAPLLLVLSSPSGEDILAAFRAGVTECLIQPASPAVIVLKALAWSMRSGWRLRESDRDWTSNKPHSLLGTL